MNLIEFELDGTEFNFITKTTDTSSIINTIVKNMSVINPSFTQLEKYIGDITCNGRTIAYDFKTTGHGVEYKEVEHIHQMTFDNLI